MRDLYFGVSLAPVAGDLDDVTDMAMAADEAGLDLLGVQDHPYVAGFVDTMSLIGHVLGRTQRIRVFPDVANLPLRPPAMLAKSAATLDLLSGGRFELGLGAGASQRAVAAMGGPRRAPAQALTALEEAIGIIRSMWRAGETVRESGQEYEVRGVHAGPAPEHDIGIWLGSVGSRSLNLTGRRAEGWAAPIPAYLPYENRAGALAAIDEGAKEAGRDPSEILRIAQLVGTVTDAPTRGPTHHADLRGDAPIRADAAQWAELMHGLAEDLGFGAFVFWPEETTLDQLGRWARDVVPAARDRTAA